MFEARTTNKHEVLSAVRSFTRSTTSALSKEFTLDHFVNRPLSFLANLSATIMVYYGIVSCLILHILKLWSKLSFLQKATNYVAQNMSNHNISFYELRTAALVGLGLFAVGSTLSSSHDDTIDSVLIGVLAYVISSLVAAVVSLGLKLLYSISPSSDGSSLRRNAISDFTNTALYILRVLLCWTRYIFYDGQVEAIDMALHYSDELFDLSPLPDTHSAEMLLITVADTLTTLVQIVLSLFKLAIAAFLLWLITDLFVQRPQVRSHSSN